MTVVVDTGPLVAYLNKEDPLHKAAVPLMERIWTGAYGVPLSTDFVLDEGLTLLRRRPGRKELSKAFASLFFGDGRPVAALQVRPTGSDVLREALRLHFEAYDRRLSFTDCTLAVHVQEASGVLASFDDGFDGIVPRVES